MRRVLLLAPIVLATGACNLLVGIEPWDTGNPTTSSASSSSSGGASSASSTDGSTTATTSSSGVGGAPPRIRCDDALRNGDESDVDCGGDACLPCPLDRHCGSDADCASLTCAAGVCVDFVPPGCPSTPDPAQPTCADCIRDGDETAIDCGGDACGPCGDGLTCAVDADCLSNACSGGLCSTPTPGCDPVDPANPSCNDCVLDGSETGVDCGGDACLPCANGFGCTVDADCASSLCLGAVCTAGP